MAPQGIPTLLALDLEAGPRSTTPPISAELQELIQRFAAENGWGARKIHAELEKLGFRVGLATVSRYLPATNVASLTLDGHLRRFIPDIAMMKTAHGRKSEKGAVQQEPGAGC